MNLNEYQRDAARTMGTHHNAGTLTEPASDGWGNALACEALGLTGEAGEVADEIKKNLFHGKPINKEHLKKELGDVLWYLAALCTTLGLDLDDVAAANLDKLRKRYPEGFSPEASAARKDETP